MISATCTLRSLIAAVFLAAIGMVFNLPAHAQRGGAELASHRAIYDLKLSNSRGRRSLAGVRGRILYDFSGTACEGYALQFRQVTELDNGEGKVATSDLRSATWEDGQAKTYRFNFQNFLNEVKLDDVDGSAERRAAGVGIKLAKPAKKRFDLDAGIVFPTEHVRRIVAAAREGKTLLELPVFDGSETGEKLYNTLTIIGREIPPDERKPTDAAAGQGALASLKRWPVTISYFDKSKTVGEQTPAYSITFELYENGVSRALSLDYGEFVVEGEMSTLEIRPTKPCR